MKFFTIFAAFVCSACAQQWSGLLITGDSTRDYQLLDPTQSSPSFVKVPMLETSLCRVPGNNFASTCFNKAYAFMNNRIYGIGGQLSSTSTTCVTATVTSFSTLTNTSVSASSLRQVRSGVVALPLGVNGLLVCNAPTCEQYDAPLDRWLGAIASPPTVSSARDSLVMAAHGGQVYALSTGGYMHVYDDVANEWLQLGNGSTDISSTYMAMVRLNDTVIMVCAHGGTSNICAYFNIVNEMWAASFKAPLGSSSGRFVMASYQNVVYAMNTGTLGHIYKFNSSTKAFTSVIATSSSFATNAQLIALN